MNKHTISVIIPVYKAESYLRRCLDSLIGQTHQNLEILLVDDGSPDGCGAICEEYAAADERIRVFHTENRGAFAARNTALDAARGEFIAFVDADDWLDRRMLEALVELLLTHETDMAQCEMKNEGDYAQIRSTCLGAPAVYEREQLTRAFFTDEITHGLLGKLFRTRAWGGLRFDERFYHMDAVTLAGIETFCRRAVRMDDALYHYNTTNESITRGRRKPAHIHSLENLFEAYSAAAPKAAPEGSFFLCREIPSAGRLILPGGEITFRMACTHLRTMHRIFLRHWQQAKTAQGYRTAPKAKRLLWHIYRAAPLAASALTYGYARLKQRTL